MLRFAAPAASPHEEISPQNLPLNASTKPFHSRIGAVKSDTGIRCRPPGAMLPPRRRAAIYVVIRMPWGI
jgi:hypothetical protein